LVFDIARFPPVPIITTSKRARQSKLSGRDDGSLSERAFLVARFLLRRGFRKNYHASFLAGAAVVKDDRGAPGLDLRQALAGHDLELNDGLMGGPVQLGGLEKADIVWTPFVPHKTVYVEGRRRRPQSKILRRDDHIETPARRDQSALPLLPLGGIEERARADPEILAGLLAREDDPLLGKKAGTVGRGCML
jgi:hypothetical protein